MYVLKCTEYINDFPSATACDLNCFTSVSYTQQNIEKPTREKLKNINEEIQVIKN